MNPSAPRPDGVPPEAEWSFEVDEWVLCPRNAEGEYHGRLRTFRRDGTPSAEYEFVDGRRHGEFRTYHPGGAVAREGRYADDRLEGLLLVHTEGEHRALSLRECCVPDGARLLRQEYSAGALEGEAFFDRDGRQLMPDGALCPERPSGLDEAAIYDVVAREWVTSARRGVAREGVARRFDEGGRLIEEVTWRENRRHGTTRRFAPTGELLEESEWAHGARHGAHFRRRAAVEPGSPLFERGAFERDRPVGRWRLEAASGELVAERHAGSVRREAQYRESPVFEDHAREAAHFRELARSLRAEGRVVEALCASARSLAKDGEVTRFQEEVAATTLPFDLARGVTREGSSSSEEPMSRWLAAWWLGADTKLVLEGLAGVLGATHRASLDFTSAALLLAPSDRALRLRRAVARFELGDASGTMRDLEALDANEREVEALRQRASVLYSPFEFGEVNDDWLEVVPAELPGGVELDVERVAVTMRKAATRLELVRSALSEAFERSGAAARLPPAPAFLGGGREELECSTFELEEDGGTVTISIDERLELGGLDVPELLERARLEWIALCLLAWAAGLDRLELPRELRGRAEFKRALGTSIERCRIFELCRRRPLARNGYPGERFRGIPVPELCSPLVAFASAYYREVRAVLFYLTDPECRSLWQDDLRPS